MTGKLHFAPTQNFDCSLCGKCCGGWQILVEQPAQKAIRSSVVALRVLQETGKPVLRRRAGEVETAHTPQGRCIFLDERQLCAIQAELGAAAKPKGCLKFPFQFTRTPDGVFVGVSFYCDASRKNQGRPLDVHDLTALLEEEPVVGDQPMPVYRRLTMDWEAYRVLEDFLAVDLNLAQALAALAALLAPAGGRAVQLDSNQVARALAGRYDLQDQARVARPHLRRLLKAEPRALPGADLERYLRALLFRKFLVADRPIAANLAILYLLPELLGTMAERSRLERGASQLEPQDLDRALSDCEFHFVTHASGLDRAYTQLVSALVRSAT